jgi:hypothetical protein
MTAQRSENREPNVHPVLKCHFQTETGRTLGNIPSSRGGLIPKVTSDGWLSEIHKYFRRIKTQKHE